MAGAEQRAGRQGLPERANGTLEGAVCRDAGAGAEVLKNGGYVGCSDCKVRLHGFAFLADDVANAVTSVPQQVHAASDAYEGHHAAYNGAGHVVIDVGSFVHVQIVNTQNAAGIWRSYMMHASTRMLSMHSAVTGAQPLRWHN